MRGFEDGVYYVSVQQKSELFIFLFSCNFASESLPVVIDLIIRASHKTVFYQKIWLCVSP